MSLKPGIGAEWFKRYGADVYGKQAEPALDRVVVNGQEGKPPKYYDTLLGREDEYRLEYVKFMREQDALRRGDSELTPAFAAARSCGACSFDVEEKGTVMKFVAICVRERRETFRPRFCSESCGGCPEFFLMR